MIAAARSCKHVYDAFVEHLNSVFSNLLPSNTPITPELVQQASAIVKPRWTIRDSFARLLGMNTKSSKPEIQQDRDRVRSPRFKPTLDAAAEFVVKQFQDILEAIQRRTDTDTDEKFVDKVAIGFAWVPQMVEMYKARRGRSKMPKDDATKAREAAEKAANEARIKATASNTLAELKRTLTYEQVVDMGVIRMKDFLIEVGMKRADVRKLRKKDGTLLKTMCDVFELQPAAPP